MFGKRKGKASSSKASKKGRKAANEARTCVFCGEEVADPSAVYCPACGAVFRQRDTRFSFVADLSGASVKELMQSMEVTL